MFSLQIDLVLNRIHFTYEKGNICLVSVGNKENTKVRYRPDLRDDHDIQKGPIKTVLWVEYKRKRFDSFKCCWFNYKNSTALQCHLYILIVIRKH